MFHVQQDKFVPSPHFELEYVSDHIAQTIGIASTAILEPVLQVEPVHVESPFVQQQADVFSQEDAARLEDAASPTATMHEQ